MEQLLDRVPAALFWGLVAGWVFGVWTAWRFARYVERFRDAVNHARHHYARAIEFVRFAKSNVVGLVMASGVFLVVVGGVGTLVWMRVTGA
jgi:hypothetical protein